MQATGYVLFYAILAAVSPLVLTVTFVVLRSERPRSNGVAFSTGFVVGTTIACVLGLIVGQAAVDRLDSHETVEAVVALVLGVGLVFTGLRERHEPSRSGSGTGRRDAILTGLGHIGPRTALSMAGVLGFGGPKRLVLTLLAMASVSDEALADVEQLTLVVIYVAVSTLVVSVPVGVTVVAGDRAAVLLGRCESWMKAHAAQLRIWLSTGLGGALVVDGVVRLLG